MGQSLPDVTRQNRVFVRIVLATGLILLVPWIAMQITTEVNWDPADFTVMGSLLSGAAGLFVLATRRATHEHHRLIGGILVAAFLLVWAELAVGVLTSLGS